MDHVEYINRQIANEEHQRSTRLAAISALRSNNVIGPMSEVRKVVAYLEEHANPRARYHSPHHMYSMVLRCDDAISFYFRRNEYDMTIPSRNKQKALLVAALFHDIGHSGGTDPDSLNVARSMYLYSQFSKKMWDNKELDKLVLENIQCTQFPFVYKPVTLEQKILRDADLLQSIEPDWIDMLYINLRSEIDVPMNRFAPGQLDFMRNAEFFTHWYRETKSELFYNRLEEAEKIANVVQLSDK